MSRESILRCSLWVAAVFNIGGALLFAFPESFISRFAGLPGAVPIVYRAFTAFFIILFAGAYVWLANHRPIAKPFVAFGAIGKAGAFTLTLILCFADQVPWRSVVAVSGDMILAAIFVSCIVGAQQDAQEGRAVKSRAS